MQITGTFLDEISHDIPHQNWSETEWAQDFRYMKEMGIDTVVMIRCGYRNFLTYPSVYLMGRGCYQPSVDLVEMFLRLSEKEGMQFYFGLYDSGRYWDTGDMLHEAEHNRFVIDEVWRRYGHYPAFKGWYLSMEISRKTRGAIETFQSLGRQCREISSGLPVLISPWIDGRKAVATADASIQKSSFVSAEVHEQEWNEIFDGISGAVDTVAFQDGHVSLEELPEYLAINKGLADRYGLNSWTNCESFDRDMPIKFLPIKFEKLKLKLEAAARAGCSKAISFEFPHFMSPQSIYPSAHHLYRRYMEYKAGLI